METTQKQELVEQVSKALKEQLNIAADRITGSALQAWEEMPDNDLPGLDIVIKVRLEHPESTRARVQLERVNSPSSTSGGMRTTTSRQSTCSSRRLSSTDRGHGDEGNRLRH